MSTIEERFTDPQWIQQDYEAMRGWLLEQSERTYQDFLGISPDLLQPNAQDKTVDKIHESTLGKFDIRPEDIEKASRAYGRAYESYYDSVIRPKILEDSRSTIDWRQAPLEDVDLDPRARQAIPYAVLATASDKSILEEKFPGAEIHGSWKWAQWKFSPTEFYKSALKIDIKGKGSGLVGFIPAFNVSAGDEVSWIYLWVPTYTTGTMTPDILVKYASSHASYSWHCTPEVDLNGSFLVYAWDTCFTSKEASAWLKVSTTLIPAGAAKKTPPKSSLPPGGVSVEKTIFYHTGDNILKGGPVKGKHSPGKISPIPGYVFKPHWIIVRVSTAGSVRGDGSHVLVDFQSNNYDIFSWPVKVWESGK